MSSLIQARLATIARREMDDRTLDPGDAQDLLNLIESAVAIRKFVDEQAEDDGLWFFAQTASEAYLQQELRKLHALIERATMPESPSLFHHAATLGQLRELTEDLPDFTPIVVVIRKAHDPDHFYETVVCEEEPHVDLLENVVVLTAPEPRDIGV